MLRRLPPCLRRALLASSSTPAPRRGVRIQEPVRSPLWRLCSSAPPPPPPSTRKDALHTPGRGSAASSSLNPAEVAHFNSFAETWWDTEGPFKPLHVMNPTRLSFIRSILCKHFRRDPNSSKPLEGLKVIDVGCAAGILSEPLARMGATVTGIDAADECIKIARVHAASDPLTASIEYFCTTAEDLVKENKQFDAVICLEVIEHVDNPSEFCESLSALTVPNGATVISTINRSIRAFATMIVALEYIFHWIPKGTHHWSKLVTPDELVLMLEKASVYVQEMAGIGYNPWRGNFSMSDDTSVNYFAYGIKKVETPQA
uniref:Ubiquinone biosynthesis O-methyltransferase, mitochondrial n=1 Tax=Oryza punctata TaxID=4537 RepID=A0A0E0L7Y8_ORYPU